MKWETSNPLSQVISQNPSCTSYTWITWDTPISVDLKIGIGGRMPSYKLRNMDLGPSGGTSEEMKFCSRLHRGVYEAMLGARLILENSFIAS